MKIKLTYTGRIIFTSGKLGYRYVDNKGEPSLFSRPIVPAGVGAIIECEKTELGVKAPYKLAGKMPEGLDLSQLISKDWANKKEYDITRDFKKVNNNDYKNILERINSLTRRLSKQQKQLFKYKLLIDLK